MHNNNHDDDDGADAPLYVATHSLRPTQSTIGVAVVTNPLHLLSDWRMMGARLGSTRAGPLAYALRSLLAAGVEQAFGSDWPVVAMDCIGAMHVAVHRVGPPDADGSKDAGDAMPVWAAEEKLTPEEALLAHTAWAANVCGGDDRIGSLRYVCGDA